MLQLFIVFRLFRTVNLSTHAMSLPLLLHELFFSLASEKQTKIASYRLPTHRRGAHRIFFDYPVLFQNVNFGHTYTKVTDMQLRVNKLQLLNVNGLIFLL